MKIRSKHSRRLDRLRIALGEDYERRYIKVCAKKLLEKSNEKTGLLFKRYTYVSKAKLRRVCNGLLKLMEYYESKS